MSKPSVAAGVAGWLAVAALVAACDGTHAPPAATVPAPQADLACDRACLYGVLDTYLAALEAHDPQRVPWAKQVKNTENNVEIAPGDGLWGTITGLDAYQMRIADAQAGQVGIFGVLEETTTRAPYAMRLKVAGGQVSEVETIVVRPQDAGVPFVTADIEPLPLWSEIIPEAERDTREALIAAANGYFETIQLNDGTMHVEFTDDCNRRENGKRSTNLTEPDLDAIWRMGCAEQFRLGAYRYDDRLRGRRFIAVDQEQGIVLAGGFIDHEGRLGSFQLTDGTMRESFIRRPHTFVLLEAFKVQKGKIRQVEAAFITVPYNMSSPWDE